MTKIYAAFGVAGLLAAGSASATTYSALPGNAIFSSFQTNAPDNSYFAVAPGNSQGPGSPDSQEFTITQPEDITSLTFRLSDATPNDGGSILVYLVPNGSSNQPSNNGATSLTNATQIGTILDSTLPTSGVGGCTFPATTASQFDSCNTTINVNTELSPGTYWISLAAGNDPNNGGNSAAAATDAEWWRTGDNAGLGTSGMYNSHITSTPSVAFKSLNSSVFELQIDAPEPASMAVLGIGLMGLGLSRWRRAPKSAG